MTARLDDIGVNQELAGALGSLALGSPVVLPDPVSSLATLGFCARMASILATNLQGPRFRRPPSSRSGRRLDQGGRSAADGECVAGERGCCAR